MTLVSQPCRKRNEPTWQNTIISGNNDQNFNDLHLPTSRCPLCPRSCSCPSCTGRTGPQSTREPSSSAAVRLLWKSLMEISGNQRLASFLAWHSRVDVQFTNLASRVSRTLVRRDPEFFASEKKVSRKTVGIHYHLYTRTSWIIKCNLHGQRHWGWAIWVDSMVGPHCSAIWPVGLLGNTQSGALLTIVFLPSTKVVISMFI